LLNALVKNDIVEESTLMMDSTINKVHQHGSGKKGAKNGGEARED